MVSNLNFHHHSWPLSKLSFTLNTNQQEHLTSQSLTNLCACRGGVGSGHLLDSEAMDKADQSYGCRARPHIARHCQWQRPAMHYGKLRATRGKYILVAKIRTFVDILGLFDKIERVLDIYFTQFSLRKASGAIRKY